MTDYKLLYKTVEGYCKNEPAWIPLLSNVSAVIFEELSDLNWVGFYLLRNKSNNTYEAVDFSSKDVKKELYELVVGPFQGKPACIRIPMEKGVCGNAAYQMKTLRVEDVHDFPGHIACDCASNSEMVIPLFKDGCVYGVLDIDSPNLSRFSIEDEVGLKEIARCIDMAIKM